MSSNLPSISPLFVRYTQMASATWMLICCTAGATRAQTSGAVAQTRTFARVQLLETEAVTSAGVSLGDLDRDGDLDIVLAKGRHWPLHNRVLRNNGRGDFMAESLADSADRTYTAALADLDGDGDLDVVVSNDRPDRKLVYLNDGTGRYRVGTTFGQPDWSTRYVTVADVNGDKRPDLLVANRSGNPAAPKPSYVCLNDGAGAFPVCRPLATQSATIIVAADLDGDGHVDLFVPHRDGGQNLIFWNEGSGSFSAEPTKVGPASSAIRAAAVGDLDGDGRLDIVVGDQKAGLFFYRSAGRRAFAEPTPFGDPKRSPYSIAIADLDKDGHLDMVVGNDEALGAIYFGIADRAAGGQPRFRSIDWNDGKGAVYGVALGDLNGDGWLDIVAARSDAPNGIWWSDADRKR